MGDRDTHWGRLLGNGSVLADCGLTFRPKCFLRTGGPGLPGYPPDPGQVCPTCKKSRSEPAARHAERRQRAAALLS